MPQSVLVRANNAEGMPVMMVINPDSVAAVTAMPPMQQGGQGGTAGASGAVGGNAGGPKTQQPGKRPAGAPRRRRRRFSGRISLDYVPRCCNSWSRGNGSLHARADVKGATTWLAKT